MRVLRTSLVMVGLLGLAPALAVAQSQTQSLLTRYTPVFKGVEYDLPASVVKGDDPAIKATVDACKSEYDTKSRSYIVKDGQGKLLRRFVDTNGEKTQREGDKTPGTHLDQWSYYQDGFEVYRESDINEDGTLDEVRWMNSGGTRVAKVKPNANGRGSQIVAWSRISAEEASKVLVQSLIQGDASLLETVLATPDELKAIGAPESTQKRAAASAETRAKAFQILQATLNKTGWTGQTTWSRFDGSMPHVIPADAPGLKGEVILYENVVVFPDDGNPALASKLAYLSAPEIVKIGDAWKFIELPIAVDPVKPVGGNLASLRRDIYATTDKGPGEIPIDPAMVALLKKLGEHDAVPVPDGDKVKKAEWHVERLKILRGIIALVIDPTEKLNYQKQVVNDLAEAIKTEKFPELVGVLDKLVAGGGKIASFAAYRKILVQFDLDAEQPGANLLEVQTESLAKFEKFLADFVQSDEIPEVLLQLATVNDFNNKEKEAREWYARLAKDHPTTEPGKKAAGAIKRLDLDNKPLKLAGAGVQGKAVSVDDFKGKPLLVVYWTSLSEGDQKELKELAALREKLGPKGFDVLSVSLDDDRKALDAYLKANPLPWNTIHEPGGMDSRLANELGIISTPTMFLLDSKGVVVNRKIRKAAEVERALDKALAGRGVGLNLK
ncbi:MAG: resA 16 [Planctomycetota bacterium]|nr:resA 16 [Planctomycetota bacterium]